MSRHAPCPRSRLCPPRLPAVLSIVSAAALLLAGCGSRGRTTSLTIVADPGPFPDPRAAAHAEARVDWRDADPTDDDACTRSFAAHELATLLPGALGIPAERVTVSGRLPERGDAIVIGRAGEPLLRALGLPPLADPDPLGESYRLRTLRRQGRTIWVVEGAGRVGALYGSYALLDRLGVAFYTPDTMGTVLPAAPARLPEPLREESRPAFATRGFWAWEPRGTPAFFLWMARNRMNLWTAAEPDRALLHKLGIRLSAGGHMIQKRFLDPDGLARDGRGARVRAHPEWYGLIGGRRSPRIGLEAGDNFCTSNGEAVHELLAGLVDDLADGEWRDADVVALWMLDAGRWCECPACAALGTPTDRLLALVAAADSALGEARRTGRIRRPIELRVPAFLETLAPPTRQVPAGITERVAVTLFPIDRCYAHALADPACTEINAVTRRDLEGWTALGGRIGLEAGEYYNLGELKSLPAVYARVIGADVPWYHARGVRHFHYMHAPVRHWGPFALDHALLARLLWDPAADPVAIRERFLAGYYPVSHAAMGRAYAALERASANLKLLKHRARTPQGVYQLHWQLKAGVPPLILDHLRMAPHHPRENDAPDLTEMSDAATAARVEVRDALAATTDPAERARLAIDLESVDYLEATVAFFRGLLEVESLRREGREDAARAAWPSLRAAAERLRGMTDVVAISASHANAANGFEATRVTDVYAGLEKRYAGSAAP